MKKIYFVLALLFMFAGSYGQVLLTENFSYTTGTAITANGWMAHSAGGTNAILVTTPGLTYTNHPGSGVGNAITMTTSGEDDNRTLSTPVTTGSAYASFLLNVNAAQAAGDYFIGLLQSGTVFPLRIYARSSGAGFNIGISKSSGAVTYDAGVLTFGTTYFIVVKYVYNAGANDDAVSLWVNPALGGAETAATIPNVTGAVADATTLTAFYVRQGTAANAPTPRVDAILVGNTWADVTPSAGGIPNIVVSPTSLTGFTALSGVPSADQNYTVSGSDLTADISIAPPAGFEISTTNAPFTPTNPITLTQTGGVVANTTIYVRMNSATLGTNTGNITHTSTGSNNPNVALTGKVLDVEPTTQGSITVGTVTNSTIQVTLTAGNGAKQLLAIHALTPVANDPVDGTTYTANTAYGAGSNLGANTYVVFNGVSGNGGAPITITGLAVATTYHFAVYEFNDGGGISGAENYLVTTPGTANATTLNIVNTYTWTGANGTLWTDPLNWLPVRTTPATNDSLLFVGPLTVTVTGVPAETIGYMGISLGSNVTLQAAVNNTTLNIGAGFTGEDLELEAGSQLNISGANGYTINILTGNTSIIDGDMTFSGGAHKFTAADASGITFNTGSSFTAGTGFSSNPFGTTGTANSVVFVSGSTFNQVAGSNPFALAQPASIVVFQTGSLFRMLSNLAPSLSGRTYADLEIDNAAFSQSGTGGGALSIDNLTITQGLLLGLNTTGGISIKGNITTVAGSTLNFLSASANTVTFNGAAAQTINIGGTLGWGANESLTINNANGVQINRDITIGATATLALTNGILKLNAPASMLTLSAGTTLTGGNSNASYVDGKVRKIGNTDFTFPIGKTGFGYVPIRVSNFAGGAATDQFDAEYLRGNARLLGPITDPLINHVSGCDWWTLDRTNGTPTVDVTAYWSANNVCNGTYVDNLATLALVHFDGTNWNSSSVGFNPPPNGTIAAGDITWPGVTTFSPFALGSTATDNPLPITINYFTGVKQNGDHQLNWKVTCTNTPTVTMLLERSSDGRTYTPVNSITATALQCQQPFGYTDAAPAKGVNYYRLKLTDVNGKTTYSSIVSLINASSGIDVLNIAPNPIVGGRFTLKVSAAKAMNMELVITDMQGRAMQKQVLNAAAGFNTIPVDVRSLAAGTYQLYGFTAEGKTRVLRFVVQ